MKTLFLFSILLFVGAGCYSPSAFEIAEAQRYIEYNTPLYSSSTGIREFVWKNTGPTTSTINHLELKGTASGTFKIEGHVISEVGTSTIEMTWSCMSYGKLTLYKNRVEITTCAEEETHKFREDNKVFFEKDALEKIHKYFPDFSL